MSNSFCDKVYKITRQIPKGKVATYGQIAKLAGNPKAARAVGVLMRNNPDFLNIPCHRIVGRDGCLTGYSGDKGVAAKKTILEKEGVVFKGNKVDLGKSLW